jgi:fatty acid desaturase
MESACFRDLPKYGFKLPPEFYEKESISMRVLRYGSFHCVLTLALLSFLAGGAWMWTGFLTLALGALLFDPLLLEDRGNHEAVNKRIANAFLFLMLPLLYFNIILFNWQMAPDDWLSIGAVMEARTGWDIRALKAERGIWDSIGAYVSLGIIMATGGTTVAHELVHRVWSPLSLISGRWLLAPTLDTSFAIEHVYGHHAHVATFQDPASARRGENVFTFALRSTLGALRGAWQIEKMRLRKRFGTGCWSYRNAFLRGQLMSLAVAAVFIAAQGGFGAVSFLLLAIYGKFYLEMINYIEHYGLCRVPGQAVEYRHSWNGNKRFSLWFTFNLPRHSHHHAKGHLPYWKLQAMDEAPTLPFGYMTMILLALVPPLFRRLMQRPLRNWDRHFATPAERALL